MAIQTLNTIKNWFKTTLKPTQQQFWDTWDSFRHKFEKVPVKDVEGIDELLNTKADKTALNNHLADKNAHAPQVNTDWNSESGFSQLLNKPEFKTINGESIIGTSNIDVASTLQQVMDKGSAAIIDGEAGILSTSNNGYSRFYLSGEMAELNNLDTDLKKAVSMSLKDGDLKITSQNTATGKYTTVNLSEDPKVNTEIFFPNKEVAGNYTLATLDDITGGTQDLQSVIENGGLYQNSDGTASIIIFPSIAPKNFGVGVYGTGEYSYTSFGLTDNQMQWVNSTGIFQASMVMNNGKMRMEQNILEDGGKSTYLEFKTPIASRGGENNGANVFIPAPDQGEYTIPVRIKYGNNYYTASDNGDIEIPTPSSSSQNIDQVLAAGSTANNKTFVLRDNSSENNKVIIGTSYVDVLSKFTTNNSLRGGAVLSTEGGTDRGESFITGILGLRYSYANESGSNIDMLTTLQTSRSPVSTFYKLPYNDNVAKQFQVIPVTVNGVSADKTGNIEIETGGVQNLQQSLLANNRTNQSIKVQDEAPDTDAYVSYVSYTSEGIKGKTETGHAYYYSSDGMRVSAVGGGELTYTSGDRSLMWNADTENPKSNRLSLDKTTDGEAVFNLPEKATGNYTLATTDDILRQGLENATILYHKLPFLQEGTISNTGTSVTGVGTDFDVWDIGSKIVKANGETAIIATVTNGLSITTVEPFATDSSSSTYKVYHKAYELMEDGATNFYSYNRGVSPTIKITADNTVRLHDQEFRPNGNVQGINEWKFGNTALYEDDIKLFKWGSLLSSPGPNEPTDIGFKRHEAGIWEINNGTPENYADLMLRKVVMTATDYSNDTDADADTTLPSGGLYTVNGDRTVRRKP